MPLLSTLFAATDHDLYNDDCAGIVFHLTMTKALLVILYVVQLFQGQASQDKPVIFTDPVHVIADQNYTFQCRLRTPRAFSFIGIVFAGNQILSVIPGDPCQIDVAYRTFVTNCTFEDGQLNYEMAFTNQLEGVYSCNMQISRNEKLSGSINVLVNASSPQIYWTKKDFYYENELINVSCEMGMNRSNVMIVSLLTMKNGQVIELGIENTTVAMATKIQFNTNRSMDGALLGCGIQYEFSRYVETYGRLNVLYRVLAVEIRPRRERFYGNDTVVCYGDGNPIGEAVWVGNSNGSELMANDTVAGPGLVFSEVLGRRSYACRVTQMFRNDTLVLHQNFSFDVVRYQATESPPTPRWVNISLGFVGDRFATDNSGNNSLHRWEISPKWSSYINGSLTVNNRQLVSFNNTDAVIVVPGLTFLWNLSVTFFSFSYKLSESAEHGMYRCAMTNQYGEQLEASTFFIKGQNPVMSLERRSDAGEERFLMNCSTSFLGSPAGTLQIIRRNRLGEMEALSNKSSTMNLEVERNFDWRNNGDSVWCENRNEFYAWLSESAVIDIIFAVRDLTISPNISEYSTGDVVKCSARGNPTPNISWSANVNGSFYYVTSPDVIRLTPPAGSNATYNCSASNIINGQQYSIYRSISVSERYLEFVSLSVTPPVIGWSMPVRISCAVDKMSGVSVMIIKDNSADMVSIESGQVTVDKSYRHRIDNVSVNVTDATFFISFANETTRNISCMVIFQSQNRNSSVVELRNIIEMTVVNGNVTKEGVRFNGACVQRVRPGGNGLVIRMGLVARTGGQWVGEVMSNSSDTIQFSADVKRDWHDLQLRCTLSDRGEEIGWAFGDLLYVVYLSNLRLVPEKQVYTSLETIVCQAEGRPPPTIRWERLKGTDHLNVTESTLLLAGGRGDYSYNCLVDTVYKTQAVSASKTITFRVGNARDILRPRWTMNLVVVLLLKAFF